MEYSVQLQKLCQIETRRYILIVGMIAITYLMFQSSMLPYGNAIKSLLPDNEVMLGVKNRILAGELSVESEKEDGVKSSSLVGFVKEGDQSSAVVFNRSGNGLEEIGRMKRDMVSPESEGLKIPVGFSAPEVVDRKLEYNSTLDSVNDGNNERIAGSEPLDSLNSSLDSLELNESSKFDEHENLVENWIQANSELLKNGKELPLSDSADSKNVAEVKSTPRRKKKVRPGDPPISIISTDEMNRRLARHLASSIRMKSQWSSLRDCDKEIVDAKLKIISAPASLVDKELYAPIFRNVSKFIRSYELMEKTLKVYVYKDGTKPIFHQPILKGLYASEGWFMKLMEGNKHFLVKDPEKAHLFYMPFSSRMLEYALYVPNSHNRTKLREFVKSYTESIAAKYPFWNRTGGADHLVVACHDWAPYETRHHMENSIKALCNADITIGFKIGRDVSLPETFVRYARNPLRDLGGNPVSKRNILAFFAGNSHGYLRPILLKYWKDKDPDMRIYGLLPASVSRKMNYMQHMKSSKYCICPKGFEVNSPRVVEAINHECVPVIISDNFVPPLFEVLNWDAFSVTVAEKDIPNLKNILLSIPEAKYQEMQLAVRKVQRHFLWHARPVKYDLFHMTLHSIWHSRVFQIRK